MSWKKTESKYDEYVTRIQNDTRTSLTENVKTWSSVAKSKQPVEQLIVVNAAINEAKDREKCCSFWFKRIKENK